MNVALFADVPLNWLANVLGPLTTLHAPVPTAGALAAKATLGVVAHTFWSGPAFAVVGEAVKVTATSSVLAGQGALETVQRRVYVPAPPVGVNVALFAEVLLNWLDAVLGPLTTLHAPVPTEGALADKVTLPAVIQTF